MSFIGADGQDHLIKSLKAQVQSKGTPLRSLMLSKSAVWLTTQMESSHRFVMSLRNASSPLRRRRSREWGSSIRSAYSGH